MVCSLDGCEWRRTILTGIDVHESRVTINTAYHYDYVLSPCTLFFFRPLFTIYIRYRNVILMVIHRFCFSAAVTHAQNDAANLPSIGSYHPEVPDDM